MYARKKVHQQASTAAQTAKIIANVHGLAEKSLLRFEGNDVFVYPQIWKDQATAENWIKCLHIYCTVKRQLKAGEELRFRHYESGEQIAVFRNKKVILQNYAT
ncbi:hypothetical protein [Pedobacter deserti]|uniref:hypothetical protein n=1 Tax=Pedobacter deserti TaxID=2817382 RepID=UPI00210E2E3C|nr:hypothetical protein [Pedobacter sp. SYSU D00382]